MALTLGEATSYVMSGMYGEVKDLGGGNAIFIIMQLFFAQRVALKLSAD